jgi:hypothetical protein
MKFKITHHTDYILDSGISRYIIEISSRNTSYVDVLKFSMSIFQNLQEVELFEMKKII